MKRCRYSVVALLLEILYGDLAATMPFGNSVDTFELRGDHLKEVFERAVKDELKETKVFPKFIVQVSGKRLRMLVKYFL